MESNDNLLETTLLEEKERNNRLLLFWLFLASSWNIFQYFFINVSGSWLGHYVLGTVLFIYYFFINKTKDSKEILHSSFFVLFSIWCIYICINVYEKNTDSKVYGITFLYLIVYYALVLLSLRQNFFATLKTLFISYWIIVIVFLMVAAGSITSQEDRLTAEHVNANDFSIYCNFAFIFTSLLYYFKKLPSSIYALATVLLLFFLALGQSRTNLVSFLVIFVGVSFLSSNYRQTINKLCVIIITIVSIWSMFFHASSFYDRFKYIREESVKSSRYDNIVSHTIENVMGERSTYYFDGWEIFLDNPITGIGYNNYINHPNNRVRTVCHVEVMSQLSEEGLVGFILYVLIFCNLLARISQKNTLNPFKVFLLLLYFFIMLESIGSILFPRLRYVALFAILYYLSTNRNNTLEEGKQDDKKEDLFHMPFL